ncbi:MAG TPA: serine--tRNA ligase [Actinomycetota bacterium]|nr:serine--tRNA ligase [Actinomycetota bacterium]
MLDLRAIRDEPEPARRALARRSSDLATDLDRLLELDAERRRLTTEVEALRAEQNRASRAIGSASAEDRQRQIDEVRRVSDRQKDLEPALLEAEEQVRVLLDRLPNLPHGSVPEGETDEDNEILREVGERPDFPFEPRDHVDLGTTLGVIDLERGARLSGTRFAYLLGGAAVVQFALVRYCLDRLQSKGFVPVIPPVLVREEAMYGTGFLPTDEAQLYVTREDELYLVGTSEVALAGLHQGELLEPGSLPRRYVGYSTCFRREAGAHGKDTRGIFRVHQFDKVEMFSFTDPSASWDEHEFLLSCEEELVQGLEVPYRVTNVCTGELGASAAKKYDLEAWLPGQGRYRELTSCSNTTDYQARRLGVRVRTPDGNRPAHTLNGTACAVGRTLIALLENHQRQDGSVTMPEVLHPYLPDSFRTLRPG